MKRSEIFIFCCLSFIIGIGFGLAHDLEILLVYIFFFAAAVFLTVFWRNINLRILFFGILFLFFGMMRVSVETRHCLVSTAGSGMYGEKIKMQGIILDEPENFYDRQRFAFDAERIKVENLNIWPGQGTRPTLVEKGTRSTRERQGFRANRVGQGPLTLPIKRILVNANLYPKYNYGDRLEIECKLKKPEPFGNFRYDKYLELDNISAICYWPKISIMERNQGNALFAGILKAKQKFNGIITMNVDEPQASIMSAILLGNKYGVSSELKDIFSRAGISHILAVSGMHIGILGIMLLLFLNFIGISRKKAFYFSCALIIVYVIMIGAPASAARAALMGLILMAALQFGRLAKFLNAVMLAACFMLIVKPGLLFYDIGFQFSFIAILGIYFLYPVIKKFLSESPPFIKSLSRACRGRGKGGFFYGRNRVEKKNVAREEKISAGPGWLRAVIDILSLSLAAEIFILPLSIYYFSNLSLIAPFANLAVIWLVPFIMFLGLALIFSGCIVFYLPILSFVLKLIAVLISFLLGYFIFAAKILSALPWASFEITTFPLWGVILCYAVIAGAVLLAKRTSFVKGENR